MTKTKLIRSIAIASCLLLPMLIHSQEPRGHSEVLTSRLNFIDAETNVKIHELELKMSELAVAEATIELDKLKLHLESVDPHEIGHVEQEVKQAAIRVEMRKVQSEMARIQMERAKAELKQMRASEEKERESKRREQNSEREVALQQLKTIRIAMQGLLDAGREDAELLHRAIRAQEVTLEGRRDEEAHQIRESAPTLGQRVELLMFAADKLREAGKTERAEMVGNLGNQLRKRFRNQRVREREGERADRGPEARVAAEQIEVMQTALVALREGERQDAAELLKRAIQARQVRLRRLKGAEAETVLEREPTLGNTVEVLMLASSLWSEFGHEEKAATVGELAELWAKRDRNPVGERELPETDERIRWRKHLEDELAELQAVIEKANHRIEELRRKLHD